MFSRPYLDKFFFNILILNSSRFLWAHFKNAKITNTLELGSGETSLGK